MPSINDPTTIRAIARAFVSNGHKRGEALIEAGYAPRYANSGHCAKIYDRKEVKEAIEGYEADVRVNSDMTVEKVQALYMGAHDLALEHNQPSAAVSAITGIARLYGMDKDASQDKQEAKPLTDQELEHFRQAAKLATGPTLKRNTA